MQYEFNDTGRRCDSDAASMPICADLSRNDWAVLHELCKNKNVVEVGSGGSTVMLASVASHLVSYESDEQWFQLVKSRMAKLKERCATRIVHTRKPPRDIGSALPEADVYFIDCYAGGRGVWLSWVLSRQLATVIVIHDSMSDQTLQSMPCLIRCPEALHIDEVRYHWKGSNMLVVIPRAQPVVYENWNHTEKNNRQRHLHKA